MFVLVSTDKAVNPANIMGASKRAVKILQSFNPESDTTYMAVRFGNVLESQQCNSYFSKTNSRMWPYHNYPS